MDQINLVSKKVDRFIGTDFLREFEPTLNPKIITEAQVLAIKPFVQGN